MPPATTRPHAKVIFPLSAGRRCLPHPINRSSQEALNMTWETPTAIDFRFGFEITMYIAAR
jgi:coenzyme PQQ precursor peptide PqqA